MTPSPQVGRTASPPPAYASLAAPPRAASPAGPSLPQLLRYPQLQVDLGDGHGVWVSGDVLVRQSRHWQRVLGEAGLENDHGGDWRVHVGADLPPQIWWQVLAYMHGHAQLLPCPHNAAGVLAALAHLDPDPGEGGSPLRRLDHRFRDWVVDQAEVAEVVQACGHAQLLASDELLEVAAPWLLRRLDHPDLLALPAATLASLLRSTPWLLRQRACQAFALRWLQHAQPNLAERTTFLAFAGLADLFAPAQWHTEGLLELATVSGVCSVAEAAELRRRRLSGAVATPLQVLALTQPPQRRAHWPSLHGGVLALERADDWLLSAGLDGNARLWDPGEGRCLHHFVGAAAPLLAASWLAAGQQVRACGSDGAVYSWPWPNELAGRATSSAPPRKLFANPTWQPPVPAAALGGPSAAFGQHDGTIRLLHLEAVPGQGGGAATEAPGLRARVLAGHAGPVGVLAFAGQTLLSGGADQTVRAWDTSTGLQLACWDHPEARPTALFATFEHVLSGDCYGGVQLASLVDGGLVWRQNLFGHVDAVALAGAVAVALAEGRLYALDLRTGTVRWQGSAGEAAAYRLAMGHNALFTAAKLGRADFLQRHEAGPRP